MPIVRSVLEGVIIVAEWLQWLITGSGAGLVVGVLVRHLMGQYSKGSAEKQAKELRDRAQQDAELLIKDANLRAREETVKRKQSLEREITDKFDEVKQQERRLSKRESNLDKKTEMFERKEAMLDKREKQIADKENNLDRKIEEADAILEKEKLELQKISGLSRESAQELLLGRIEKDVRAEASERIARIVEETQKTAEKKSKEILSQAIQRFAAEHTAESTVSSIDLPSDEMKGRIIGREGRNIRAFEKATGVDVIVDDTPGVVVVSGFDPVRREVACRAMEKLVLDGRVHPARIEEVVEKAHQEVMQIIVDTGNQVSFDLDVPNIHAKLLENVGRLRYRTSYGQNALQHSKEVAYLMGIFASELKLDAALARRIGLLHDIGKAVDHEVEGTHPKIGADLCKRYDEDPIVVNAVLAHHEDVEPTSLYAVLVQAADAISASRPGARRETLEKYIKRLEKLEGVANSFPGVEKAYAIQAGREIRVIVNSNEISDKESLKVCRDIAKEIEKELTYPGEIRVTLIRETRIVEYAR